MSRDRSSVNFNIDNPASWVDQYGEFLYRFALFRVGDPAVAEDLVQETFLAALKAREKLKGHSSAKRFPPNLSTGPCRFISG